jgi:hypothetical protein
MTALFFIDETGTCKMVRWMSDYSNINDMLDNLNSNYKKLNKNTWYYDHKGARYLLNLEEGEWFFTITTKAAN